MNKRDVIDACFDSPHDAGVEPLVRMYEGKMLHQFDHRFGSYMTGGQLENPTDALLASTSYQVQPRKWMPKRLLDRVEATNDQTSTQMASWQIAFRDFTNSTNERTVIAAAIPREASDFTVRVLRSTLGARHQAYLLGLLNSFAFDYVARQMVGGTHMSDYITKQLPAPDPHTLTPLELEYVADRVLRLSYTSDELEGMSVDLDSNLSTRRWSRSLRQDWRDELDAYFLQKLGLDLDTAAHILESFPILRADELRIHGEFRTKAAILALLQSGPTPLAAS